MKNESIKLVSSDAKPSRLLQEHSAVRMRLAALINRKLTVERNLRHLAEAAQRLQDAQRAEQHAVAALNALGAVESSAMAAWSRDPSGPAPEPNVAKREDLQSNHRAAVAKAEAARGAEATIAADQQREAATLKALDPEIREAIVAVLIESTTPLLEEVKEMQASLARKQGRLNQAVNEAIEVARSTSTTPAMHGGNSAGLTLEQVSAMMTLPVLGQPVGSTGTMIGQLVESFRVAQPHSIETSTADVAAWKSLSTRLRSDPLAELEI